GRLADFLRAVPPGAVASTLRFLSGRSGRERLGVGPAAVDEAWRAAAPAAEATLGLEDVIAALAAVRDLCGEGSAAERSRRLGELFARATAPERSFLARWLVGELRQGALEGVLTEAVAAAAGIEAATVREALMVEGDLAVVGEQALRAGRAGLAGGAIQLFRPVLPMLDGASALLPGALAGRRAAPGRARGRAHRGRGRGCGHRGRDGARSAHGRGRPRRRGRAGTPRRPGGPRRRRHPALPAGPSHAGWRL